MSESSSSAAGVVLWVHGYTLSARVWDLVWPHFTLGRHVGFDLPGHGASREAAGLGPSVKALLREADRHGADYLAAMSFGASVAVAALATSPTRFKGAILAAPGLPGGEVDAACEACNLDLERMARERGLGPWLAERWLSSPPAIFDGLRGHPSAFAHVQAIVARHRFEEVLTQSYADMQAHKVGARELAQIRTRLTLVVGEYDMAAFRRAGEIIRRSAPVCRRIHLAGVGHLPFLEAPMRCGEFVADMLNAA